MKEKKNSEAKIEKTTENVEKWNVMTKVSRKEKH